MKISVIIIIVLSIISLSLFIYLMYVIKSKKYTRERFAFTALTLTCSLAGSLLTQIYSSQDYASVIVDFANFTFHKQITPHVASWEDLFITAIIFGFLFYFIIQLHKNWNGPISVLQHDKQRFNVHITIYKEFIVQFQDFFNRTKLIIPYIEAEHIRDQKIFPPTNPDQTPWHLSVMQMLSYSYSQYHISEDDYYPDEKTLITSYGKERHNVAILCSINYPDESMIENFISFVDRQGLNFYEYIIAVKNGSGFKESIFKCDKDIIIRLESEMLDNLIDFSYYAFFLKEQFSKRPINEADKYTVNDIYVPVSGKIQDSDKIDKIEDYVFDWINNNRENKHLAILGEYGCGKSVLSLKIAYTLLENWKPGGRFPVLIELRGKSPRNSSKEEILAGWGGNFRIDPAALLKLHKAGRLLLIFEGFDEMDMIGDRELRLNHFQRLWEFATPKAKIIITGRPNFFLDDKELRQNLGVDRTDNYSTYCEAVYIEKFRPGQIENALRNVEVNTREQVLKILKNDKSGSFYDLVSRPAILYLVAVLWKSRLEQIKDKINSALVISEFIKYSYIRQSEKNANLPLTQNEREYFMLGLAVGMLKINQFSNQINKNDMEAFIMALYRNFPNDLSNNESAMRPKIMKPLKERMIDNNDAEETIFTDVRSSGIIVNDLARKDYFKFAHKSFLEYQVSYYYVESLLQDKGEANIIMNAITTSIDFSLISFTHSEETIAFTSEILLNKLNLAKLDPQTIAAELFKLLYPIKFLSTQPRLAALLEINMNVSSLPWNFLLLSFICAGSLLLFRHSIFFQDEIFSGYLKYIVFFISSLAPAFALATVRLNRLKNKKVQKDGELWYRCCKQLQISHEDMAHIVPKIYISYLEGTLDTAPKVMAYFLKLLR